MSIMVMMSGFVFADASENKPDYSKMTPYEVDRLLHGDVIDEEIVMYDETTGVYLPSYYDDALGTIVPNAVDPVDPGSGGGAYWTKYFSKIAWVSRGGVWSLSLTPRGNVGGEAQVWNSIQNSYSSNFQWASSGNPSVNSSMKNQYTCHLDFAFTGLAGPTWDLEPSKPDKGYWGFVAGGCN